MAGADGAPSALALRLGYQPPFDFADVLSFLGDRAVPGVEEVRDGAYRRVLRLPHGSGIVALWPVGSRGRSIGCHLWLADPRDQDAAIRACRDLLDLDADPGAILAALGDDPLLGPLVRDDPGRRVPGHPDPHELAVRAVLGQQVSVAAARTLAGRLAAAHGEPVADPEGGGLSHAFPTAAALAEIDAESLAMPRSRARALLALTGALAHGDLVLEPGADPGDAAAALQELPGIGPWTASYVRMRALGDRDVFLPTDLGVRHALAQLGEPGDPRSATATAERWRPWRSYALMHLWSQLGRRPRDDHGDRGPA
jgi:AraC family transcriptional regulator of adaptative response / DNA-3-methyladenine glycosylase II